VARASKALITEVIHEQKAALVVSNK
jgi:hypothetical protein